MRRAEKKVLRERMKRFCVGALLESGHFTQVEPAYESTDWMGDVVRSFQFDDPDLNDHSKRHVHAVKDPQYALAEEGLSYVILTMAEKYPTLNGFTEKISALSNGGHYVLPIFVKMGGSDFLKRDRKGRAKLNDQERYVLELMGGQLFYYTPNGGHEMLQRIKFGDVLPDYSHDPELVEHIAMLDEIRGRDTLHSPLITRKRDELMQTMNSFTLVPYRTSGGLYIARAETPIDALILQEHKGDQDRIERMEERVAIQLDSLPRDELRRLTKKFGADRLGGYAVEDEK